MAEMIKFSGLEIVDDKARKDIENLKKRNFVIIGDSFTSTDNDSVSARGGADTWVTEFTRIMNAKCYNFAEGGAGFFKPSVVAGKNNNFHNQLLVASIDPTFKNSDITDIIVYGGVNDLNANTTLENYELAISNLNDVYTTHFPNARMHIFAFNNGSQVLSSTYHINCEKLRLINSVLNKCTTYGFVVHKTHTWLCGDNSLFANALHPNESGIKRITDFMIQTFNGGDGVEIPINSTGIQLVTSDGTFELDETKYSVYSDLSFNPFKGLLHGNFLAMLTKMNSIDPKFSGKYVISFDVPQFLVETIMTVSNTSHQKVVTNSYFDNSTNNQNLKSGIEFYNVSDTDNQVLSFIGETVNSFII